jgi:hypothetical protein
MPVKKRNGWVNEEFRRLTGGFEKTMEVLAETEE